ncbi:hypothetical protein PhCBS80983_g01352 [Powellomyces hirtus]|uniref:C2H2-type domain-containing protein n=1 Tax=Powellomyces hirtus TaxID=109895 RepID=A0A507EAG6_9FUNG|nr:hypothetical protein PhCBS80983_g01352 [Powellomyces hirtus]
MSLTDISSSAASAAALDIIIEEKDGNGHLLPRNGMSYLPLSNMGAFPNSAANNNNIKSNDKLMHRRRSSTTSSLLDEGYSSAASTCLFDRDELARMESLAMTSPLGSPSEEMAATQAFLSQLALEQDNANGLWSHSPHQQDRSTNGLPSAPVLRSNSDIMMQQQQQQQQQQQRRQLPRRGGNNNLRPIIVPATSSPGHRRSLPTVPTIGSSAHMNSPGFNTMRRASVAVESPMTPMFTVPQMAGPYSALPHSHHMPQHTYMVSPAMLSQGCNTTAAFYEPLSATSPLGVPPLWSPSTHAPSFLSGSTSTGGGMSRRFSVPFLPDMPNPMFTAPSALFSPSTHSTNMNNINTNMNSMTLQNPTLPSPASATSTTYADLRSPSTPSSNKQYIFVNEDPGLEPVEIPAFIDPASGEPTIIDDEGMVVSLSDMELFDPSHMSSLSGFGAAAQAYLEPGSTNPDALPANTRFKCVCGKLFEKLTSLKSHARLHRAERNHVCPTCSRAFVRRQDLKRHTSTHNTNFKPYECTNCTTTFTRSDALHRHLKAKRCM